MRRVLLACMCATVARAGYAQFELATADGTDATTGYPDRATVKFQLDQALAQNGKLRLVTASNTGAYSALSFSSTTPAVGPTTPAVGIAAGFLSTPGSWVAADGYVEVTVANAGGLAKDVDYAFVISQLEQKAGAVADRQGADNALTLVASDASGAVQERRAVYFQPWSAVPAYDAAQVLADSKVKMPDSCVCADTSKDNATCAYFSCPCTCDVTAGRCDANCCCDPDCKAAAVHGGSCTVMPSSNTAVRKCTDSRSVYRVNAKYRMRVTEESDAFGALLCVQKDNSESMGDYLQEPEPETVTDAVFTSNPNAKSLYSLEQQLAGAAVSVSATLPQAFAAGDRIPAAFELTASGADQGKFRPYGHDGYWSYPDADFAGGCGGRHTPAFLRPSTATCVRSTTAIGTSGDVARTCADSDFDIARYVTNSATAVNAAVKAGVAPSSHRNYAANDGNHWVPMTLASWTKRDLATGRDGQVAGPAPVPGTAWSSANGGECQNSVLEAHYTVTYTDAFAIESVAVALVLADITGGAAGVGAVRQSFSVRYVRKGSSPLYRLRSGNPGYEVGRPLLSGTEVSKTGSTGGVQKAVAARAAGLTLLGAFSGIRAMSGAAAASSQPAIGACAAELDAAPRTPVAFGEDASVGCTMSFTRSALKAYCETQRKASGTGALGIVPKELLVEGGDASTAIEYVGRLGDADPAKLGEWVAVNRDAEPTVEPTWDDDTSECRNLVVGVSYKVLYTGIGPVSHPQYKVLKVQASYHQSTWRYEDGPGPAFGGADRRFSLHSSISFIQWGLQQKQEYVPPAPPMIFSLPEDVFYPFKLSAASPSAAPSLGVAMVTALLCLQQLWAHGARG